jgi:hypothetical protein
MADRYITLGASGIKKKIVDLGDGTYCDAVVQAAPAHATEVILAGPSSERGKLMAADSVLDTDTIFVRCDADTRSYGTIDWRVKADQIHSIQKYRSHNIVDSVTVTLGSSIDGETGFVNGVTFTAEDTATSALRSLGYFYTGGADDTADAVQLAAAINYGAYLTIGTVLVADTVTINGVLFTAAAAASESPAAGIFHQDGTTTEDAASLAACINHKDTVTFLIDTTALGCTHPATDTTTEAYALSIELIADHNDHTALTTHHKAATAAVSSTAATTEGTLKAQVLVTRNAMLAHYADTAVHENADTTNGALVAAVASTYANAAAAVVALNLLVTAHEAHIATATCTAKAGNSIAINNGHTTYTYTSNATTTTKASRIFSTATSVTATGDELAACINDRDTITFASAVAGNSVTVNGITFYGKGSTAVAKDHRFSIDTGNNETATSFAACINDATYGVPGVTATAASAVVTLLPAHGTTITMATGVGGAKIVCKAAAGVEGITATNAAGVVSLTRNSADYTIAVTSTTTRPHKEAQVVVAHGVPGVLATSTAAEVDIAPTWADGQDFTVVTSGDTITWGRYGVPGVTATSALGVVTIVPKAVNGATCIYSKTGTGAGTWTVGQTTVAGLTLDGDESHGAAANSTVSSGKIYEQELHGYEYGYLSVNNHDAGGDKMIVTVGATLH